MGEEEFRSVELSAHTVERVEARLPRTEWDTPGEYIGHVLEVVLQDVEAEVDEEHEAVDEAAVKDRLESLGYLNE